MNQNETRNLGSWGEQALWCAHSDGPAARGTPGEGNKGEKQKHGMENVSVSTTNPSSSSENCGFVWQRARENGISLSHCA